PAGASRRGPMAAMRPWSSRTSARSSTRRSPSIVTTVPPRIRVGRSVIEVARAEGGAQELGDAGLDAAALVADAAHRERGTELGQDLPAHSAGRAGARAAGRDHDRLEAAHPGGDGRRDRAPLGA